MARRTLTLLIAILISIASNGARSQSQGDNAAFGKDANLAALMELGKQQRQRMQYSGCIATYDKVINELGHSKTFDVFYFRGVCKERVGKWDDAEIDLKKARELSPDHPAVLNYLGYNWIERGVHSNEALRMIKRAVEISPQDGYILDSLGWAHYKLGNFQEAVKILEQAEKLASSDATIKEHLADAYAKAGMMEKARSNWSNASHHFQMETDSLQVAGNFADAITKAKHAVDLAQRSQSDWMTARAQKNLAQIYARLGRYIDAEPLYKQAIAIHEKLGSSSISVDEPIAELGSLYVAQGRFSEAEPLIKRALAIREKASKGPSDGASPRRIAESLHALGSLNLQLKRYKEAELLFRRAVETLEKARFGNLWPHDLSDSLRGLGIVYRNEKRLSESEAVYQRALNLQSKEFGADSWLYATTQIALARLRVDQNRLSEAESLYKRSHSVLEKARGGDDAYTIAALNGLAQVHQLQGRLAEALALIQRIGAERATPTVALPVLLGAQQASLIALKPAVDASLEIVQRAAQTSAGVAVNKLALRLAAGTDRLAELVRKDQDLTTEAELSDKSIIAAISREPASRDPFAEQRVKDHLAAIKKQRETLQKVFADEFPDYATLSNPSPLTIQQVQELLSEDEAFIVFYAGGEKENYVIAITRDSFQLKTIPLGEDQLAQKIVAFRRGLNVDLVDSAGKSSKKGDLFDLGVAHELYDALLGSVEPVVREKKHLLVVPAGALTALPIHLLVSEKPLKNLPQDISEYRDAAWLVRRQAVTILPSVASLMALRAFGDKRPAAKPMVGFGDPIFDARGAAKMRKPLESKAAARSINKRSFTDFFQGAGVDRAKIAEALPALPDTADELRAVAKNLGVPESDIHLGSDATEAKVKRLALSDYRIVYFATHGLVAGDIKGLAEPSLALSIPAQASDIDDGLLTASEVAQLKLSADWVVLSACNTIAGDRPGAEALSGLARAFFYAGARALLVTHWAVDSNAATRLTTNTFDIIKIEPKIGRAEALRRSMLTYLDDATNPRNAYPAYWGPFVIVGEGAGR